MKSIKQELRDLEETLFMCEQKIKETKGHRSLLLDLNTTKTDTLAIYATKALNKLYGIKAKTEKRINYLAKLANKVIALNDICELEQDLDLAYIDYHIAEDKDKV